MATEELTLAQAKQEIRNAELAIYNAIKGLSSKGIIVDSISIHVSQTVSAVGEEPVGVRINASI